MSSGRSGVPISIFCYKMHVATLLYIYRVTTLKIFLGVPHPLGLPPPSKWTCIQVWIARRDQLNWINTILTCLVSCYTILNRNPFKKYNYLFLSIPNKLNYYFQGYTNCYKTEALFVYMFLYFNINEVIV